MECESETERMHNQGKLTRLYVLVIAMISIVIASTTLIQSAFADSEAATSLQAGENAATTETPDTTETTITPIGNCDKFIGLDKNTLVLAKAKKLVRVYKSAAKDSKVLGRFSKNNCIVVDTSKMKRGVNYEFLKVKLKGKHRAYVLTDNVKLIKLDTKTFGLDQTIKQNRMRAAACRKGLPYLGINYNHSGSTMKTGMSCNKFVWQCLRSSGLKMSKKSRSLTGLAKVGKGIKRNQLKPGDIVLYRPSSRSHIPSHAALYIGKGLIINSSGAQGNKYPAGGFRISHLDYRTPAPFIFRRVYR